MDFISLTNIEVFCSDHVILYFFRRKKSNFFQREIRMRSLADKKSCPHPTPIVAEYGIFRP